MPHVGLHPSAMRQFWTGARASKVNAEVLLQALLPALRKQLHMPRLEYVSIVNQGDWMIEVPVERRDIPRASPACCRRPDHAHI